jgi:hypothetical protein
MDYQEAILKSLTSKWKVDTCSQGEQCWCRIVRCVEPIIFKEKEDLDEEEYYIVGSGKLNKEIVEHIVKIHNQII